MFGCFEIVNTWRSTSVFHDQRTCGRFSWVEIYWHLARKLGRLQAEENDQAAQVWCTSYITIHHILCGYFHPKTSTFGFHSINMLQTISSWSPEEYIKPNARLLLAFAGLQGGRKLESEGNQWTREALLAVKLFQLTLIWSYWHFYSWFCQLCSV